MYGPNLKSVALPIREIMTIKVLGWGYLGEGEAVGGQGWYHSKERW